MIFQGITYLNNWAIAHYWSCYQSCFPEFVLGFQVCPFCDHRLWGRGQYVRTRRTRPTTLGTLFHPGSIKNGLCAFNGAYGETHGHASRGATCRSLLIRLYFIRKPCPSVRYLTTIIVHNDLWPKCTSQILCNAPLAKYCSLVTRAPTHTQIPELKSWICLIVLTSCSFVCEQNKKCIAERGRPYLATQSAWIELYSLTATSAVLQCRTASKRTCNGTVCKYWVCPRGFP